MEDNLFGKQRAKKAFKKQGMTNKQARAAANKVRAANAKKSVKKVGKAVKKVASKVARTIGNVALTPILPFKVAMKKILEQKGINTKKMDNVTVVETFYNKVIAKNKKNGYDEYEDGFLVNHPLMKVEATPENYDTLENTDQFDPATISLVVTAIVKYFKNAKAKKNAAKNPNVELTKEEQTAADATEKVEADLKEKELQSQGITNGQLSKYVKYIAIAVAAAFAIWFFFIRKK